MYWIEYLDKNLSGKLSNPCGDRSILILDGRNNIETMHQDAIANNGHRRPNYEAYRIMSGTTFNRNVKQLSNVVRL